MDLRSRSWKRRRISYRLSLRNFVVQLWRTRLTELFLMSRVRRASHTPFGSASSIRVGWKSLPLLQVCLISSQSRFLRNICRTLLGRCTNPLDNNAFNFESLCGILPLYGHQCTDFLSRCHRVGGVNGGELYQAAEPKFPCRGTHGVHNRIRVVLRRSLFKPGAV